MLTPYLLSFIVAPSQGRELKLDVPVTVLHGSLVAPSQGRELKLLNSGNSRS